MRKPAAKRKPPKDRKFKYETINLADVGELIAGMKAKMEKRNLGGLSVARIARMALQEWVDLD